MRLPGGRHQTTVLAAVWLLVAVAARADIIDCVLAVVGGDLIMLSDVKAAATLGGWMRSAMRRRPSRG